MKLRATLFLLAPVCSALAQSGGEPEVRRALPVDANLDSYQNPAWMERVAPAQPAATPEQTAPSGGELTEPFRPAQRLLPPPPSPTPAEADSEPVNVRAVPVATATPTPEPTPAPTPVATATDEAGSIRIAPTAETDPARSALNLGNSLYSRKMFDLAIPEYERFLISSQKEGRDAALFRLAECHRNLGNTEAARLGYEKLTMEFSSGEFAGAGAYRLGEILFAARIWDAARLQFETAAREAKDPEVRLTAQYFRARSLDALKKDADAETAYKEVAAAEGKNPYRDPARLALADIALRNGQKSDALATFEAIADSDSPAAVGAAAKAAALASEAGDRDKALVLYEKVLKSKDGGDWKPIALIGTMRLRYQGGDHKGVVAIGPAAVEGAPADSRPEALQILAASYRQLGNNLEARRTYDRLIKDYPDAAPAADARLQRLVSLYALNDKTLPQEADAFLKTTADPKARTQALLLKAEALSKAGDVAGACAAYKEVIGSQDLDPALRADVLYKLGWSAASTGDTATAIDAYSRFLDLYPSHALAASALARRAVAKQQAKDLDGALADFTEIATKYPGSSEHELALLQTALIAGQKKDYAAMATTFSELLEKFPKTAAAGQANFWLGWAAFEQKDYKAAIPKLEAARSLDPQYSERASLRIILAHYYLQDRDAVLKEAAAYKGGALPAEIAIWLADSCYQSGDYAKAESLLAPLMANPAAVPPDGLIQLTEARIRLKKFAEARVPLDRYMDVARDPASRARGMLAQAQLAMAARQWDDAKRFTDEALLLQPEGRLNAEARLASGDILAAKGDAEGAARAFMTVSVLTDDAEVTPRALLKAAEAYRRANNPFEADRATAELRQRYPDFAKDSKPKKDNT